jgi:hypothetical protein
VKRIVTWVLSTFSVLVLLFGYHTSTGEGSTGTPATAEYSGSVAGSPGGTGTPGTSGGSGAGGDTVTGDVALTRWGPVQVRLTVAGGSITDVAVPQYPNGNAQDQQISSYALPILIRETLDAQSAQIDMVSGATYTSTGYEESLQSALDAAGL